MNPARRASWASVRAVAWRRHGQAPDHLALAPVLQMVEGLALVALARMPPIMNPDQAAPPGPPSGPSQPSPNIRAGRALASADFCAALAMRWL